MHNLTLEGLLKRLSSCEASDLHIVEGSAPTIRIDGRLEPLDFPVLASEATRQICYAILSEMQKVRFEAEKELDFAFEIPDVGRFRANYYHERGHVAAAFRIIPATIPEMDELGLPGVLRSFIQKERGLVLVTGPTGSGKSTTMASMIHQVNMDEKRHIITIEDPIEFIHKHRKSLISQRNIGTDTASFATALKFALRQDPDIIYVGEMRDTETIAAAITAAETGHLVLGTLHTNSAPQSINRIIDVFPTTEQALVRTQLSMNLVGIVSQVLVPKRGGGRCAIQEILVNTPAIANLIRDDKTHQIYAQMQLNQQQTKMQTQTQQLLNAVRGREISQEEALRFASNRDEVVRALGI